ncbi:MAG: hypothetical protein RL266_2596, partial [Bacteroidota bacterium]
MHYQIGQAAYIGYFCRMRGVIGIAYPRAALIGNPSDGFGGMTIAFVFSDFRAEVRLTEHDAIEVLPGKV